MRQFHIAFMVMASAAPALAQRTTDNATTQAEDAFGKSVGNESIGLYNPFNVRGFSPVDAGNVRIEGLYFDQQATLTNRLVEGSTVRVGLSAQSYPFPAPTGIADFSLRKPGDEARISPVVEYGPFGGWFAEFDAQLPVSDTFGIAGAAGIYRLEQIFGNRANYFATAIAPRWRPRDGVEIIPFWSRSRYTSEEPELLLATAGDFLPPKVERRRYFAQPWAEREGAIYNYGVLGRTPFFGWTLRGGLFRSTNERDKSFATLFTNIQRDGTAQEIVVARPAGKSASTSGELRLSRDFDESERRHTIHVSLRAREQTRRYGGDETLNLGPIMLGVADPIAEPEFNFGAQSFDRIEQRTAGVAYELRWRDLGEFSAGVQKTDYTKVTETPSRLLPTSKDSPWLYNATGAVYLTDSLVAYASYTRGLEESPRAPDIAANRNEAPPAIRTKQIDGGLRWAIRPDLRLVAGVFEVEKPFYDLDPAKVFTQLGTVRNRGVELSLTGEIVEGLNIVAGTVFLDAEVAGEAVELGRIGKKAVGSVERLTIASVDYRLPDSPLSVDAFVEWAGDRVANQANTFVVPPRAVLSLGGRYRFNIGNKPARLRVQVANVFDNYGFIVGGGGQFNYNAPRRLILNLATDL